jgi:transposase
LLSPAFSAAAAHRSISAAMLQPLCRANRLSWALAGHAHPGVMAIQEAMVSPAFISHMRTRVLVTSVRYDIFDEFIGAAITRQLVAAGHAPALQLQLEELAAGVGEDAAKSEAPGIAVQGFNRRKATRRNFPDDLPRRRIVHPMPATCPCCGGDRLSKIGEDVTETLDIVPRQWFVTEHVREKFSCRSCETITQPPAPFHAIARGFAGPSLLAMILVEKYANHQPLNRQSEQYARERIYLSVSTMADHVGACTAELMPLHELIKAHVFAAERIHGDDTTVPVPSTH